MPNKIAKKLSEKEKAELFDALHYMNMSELKDICIQYGLPAEGKKVNRIERIIHYLKTGNILKMPAIPEVSKAKPKTSYPLKAETLILKGSFKNDLKTRKFFKSLIGEHFHYTAFGIDWIEEKWRKGKPPTYAEFAKFWQKEYLHRKNSKANPKREWAYLSFIQRYQAAHPQASKKEITEQWENVRLNHVRKVKALLRKYWLK